jgi:hypothetical protein
VTKSELDLLSDDYESADMQVLTAVRDDADHPPTRRQGKGRRHGRPPVSAESYRCFHSGAENARMPLGQLTERTEVLTDLWEDIATAYEM